MSIIQQARKLIKNEYTKLWKDWYTNHHVVPANLLLEQIAASSGYKKDEDTIYIFLPEINLIEIINEEEILHDYSVTHLGWNVWRRDLIHEMLHEYQYKVICENVSEIGIELHKKYGRQFSGEGHDPAFFTAISIQAKYFSLSPETLIQNL